ncbi:MAG: excisionase family DNA-binding protein [Mycobacterium sp.]|nr:excisionase family DNA-binding protein [Mycobacterium sp.]
MNTTIAEPALLSVDELAARWQVHSDTVRALIRDGDLASVRVGRLLRISHQAAEDYLAPACDRPAAVTVTADGPEGSSWTVAINGRELSGYGDGSRQEVERALWGVPEHGGTITVPDCGSLLVPHRAAGRAASITLAGMTGSYGGGSVSFTVRADQDPVA